MDELDSRIETMVPRLRCLAHALVEFPFAELLVEAAVRQARSSGHDRPPSMTSEVWALHCLCHARATIVEAEHEANRPPVLPVVATAAVSSELARAMHAMAALPSEQRLAVALVVVDRLAYRTAADVLGTTVEQLGARLIAGRRTLAALATQSGAALDDATILAWLDGELDEHRRNEVESLVAVDPAAMSRAEAHFLVMTDLQAAFDSLREPAAPLLFRITADHAPVFGSAALPEPIDEREPAFPSAPVLPFSSLSSHLARFGERIARLRLQPSGRGARLAAVLLVGVALGELASRDVSPRAVALQPAAATARQNGDVRDTGGALVAAGPLAVALERGLAADEAPVRVGLTFHDKAGGFCRSFDTTWLAGIACRHADGWRLRLAIASQRNEGGGIFRSTSSESPLIGQAVGAMIAGDPLDPVYERAARDAGWR